MWTFCLFNYFIKAITRNCIYFVCESDSPWINISGRLCNVKSANRKFLPLLIIMFPYTDDMLQKSCNSWDVIIYDSQHIPISKRNKSHKRHRLYCIVIINIKSSTPSLFINWDFIYISSKFMLLKKWCEPQAVWSHFTVNFTFHIFF